MKEVKGAVLIADDGNFDALHLDVRFQSFRDFIQLEAVGNQLGQRQADAVGALEEVKGDRVILRGIKRIIKRCPARRRMNSAE